MIHFLCLNGKICRRGVETYTLSYVFISFCMQLTRLKMHPSVTTVKSTYCHSQQSSKHEIGLVVVENEKKTYQHFRAEFITLLLIQACEWFESANFVRLQIDLKTCSEWWKPFTPESDTKKSGTEKKNGMNRNNGMGWAKVRLHSPDASMFLIYFAFSVSNEKCNCNCSTNVAASGQESARGKNSNFLRFMTKSWGRFHLHTVEFVAYATA